MVTIEELQSPAWKLIQARKPAFLAIPELVMDDLARFCRATQTTFHQDARLHALLEGRREVFMRIADYRDLTIEEIFRRYGGVVSKTQREILENG